MGCSHTDHRGLWRCDASTPLGRFLGAIITILGVGLAALPAGILANGIANELEQRKEKLET